MTFVKSKLTKITTKKQGEIFLSVDDIADSEFYNDGSDIIKQAKMEAKESAAGDTSESGSYDGGSNMLEQDMLEVNATIAEDFAKALGNSKKTVENPESTADNSVWPIAGAVGSLLIVGGGIYIFSRRRKGRK